MGITEMVSLACLGAMLLIVLRSMNTQFRRLNERLSKHEESTQEWMNEVDEIVEEGEPKT